MSEPAVSLRRFEPGDAAAVHRWFNNPEATRTLMEQRDSFSEEQAHAWVARAIEADGEDRKYAIVVEGHEEPVGFTALYGLGRQTAPELGALIGDDVRGKGRRPPRRGADHRQGVRRVRSPPRLRPHPRLQRGGKAGRDQPRVAPRGDDALAPATRR